jgi:type I restriction enzyme M protein
LFKGDAGSGESNIRGYLLEQDWLEAIVQLPTDLFYNTGIATYVWIITKNKPEDRIGKVQLIDASKCFEKRRKPLGNKRVEITDACRNLIMSAYRDFTNWTYTEGELVVESKVKDVEDFKYSKLFINRPLKLRYENMQMPEDAKLKPADRELLEVIIKAHAEYLGSHPVSDFALFSMLKQQKVKTTQAQVKVVRQYLGTRDASYPEVHKKPLETVGSDYEWDSELADTEIIPWKQDIAEYLDKNVRPYAPDFSVDESKTKIGYEIPFTREFYKYVPLAKSKDIFAELKALEEKEADLMNKILGGEA